MSQILDRRPNSKNKSAVNRQRFLRRYKDQIKKAVNDSASKRSIKDIDRGEKIIIPAKDIYEPRLHHGKGGNWELVHAGNKEFIPGDRIKRDSEDAGGTGSQASDSGEGWDDFGFEISREEFLELFFEDLELPNLIKKELATTPSFKYMRAGFLSSGTPNNISIIRSLRNAHARRIAFGTSSKDELREKELKLEELLGSHTKTDPAVLEILDQIEKLQKKIKKIPFLDPFDLRYRNRVKLPLPSTQAVMFCVMDVSGSMDEAKKDIAKRFFILLYLFLTHNYERIEVVFVRHHTVAKEVDEQEFFYSRETGGTVVSSALELTRDIIRERYPTADWNIYVAQASDGDNWSADSPYCQELLLAQILPLVQYYAYVEIMPRYHQSLWEAYLPIKDRFANFAMQTIDQVIDIYPVLRELFKKEVNVSR